MTSSKMSRAPWRVQSARRPARKPGRGATTPMFPATGSTKTAATLSRAAWKQASTLARSLNSAINVSRAVPSVTPGLSGRPSVAGPEPALMRKESPCP